MNPRELLTMLMPNMTTDLKSLFAEYRDLVYAEIEGKKDPARLVEKSNLQLSKKIAPCIKHIIKNLPPKSLKVNFNKLIIMLVTYFQFKGLDFNDAWTNVEPFIINYSYSATYDTPEKRKKHWAAQWDYLQNDPKYSFGCKYILGLGFPGTAFDCSTCFLKEKMPSAGSFLTNINIDDIRAGRFLNTEPDSIKWLLVDSFVIETLGLLVSNGGVGKSFFLLMLAISIAAGIPFMDDLYKIGAHGAVLVVFGEDPEETIHRRLRNYKHRHGREGRGNKVLRC